MKRLIPTLSFAAALLLTASCGFSAGPTHSGETAMSWTSCGALQCSTFTVPIDYSQPSGQQLALNVARWPATEPASGVLIVNPGGPDDSAIAFLASLAQNPSPFASLHETLDIVAFDPRGSDGSLRCFTDSEKQRSFEQSLPPYPTGVASEAAFEASWAAFAKACSQNAGPLLQHMSTQDTARDMDALRAGLGTETIEFYGQSYGTFLGETYAVLFPSRIRSLVLDAPIDPTEWTGVAGRATTPASARIGSAVASEATLRAFESTCDTAGSSRCALAPDSRQRVTELLSRPPEGTSRAAIVDELVSALQDPRSWQPLAEQLAATKASSPLAPSSASVTDSASEPAPPYGSFDARLVNECADTLEPSLASTWSVAASHLSHSAPNFAADWTYQTEACFDLKIEDDRYLGSYPAPVDGRVLVLASRYDPTVSYGDAVKVTQGYTHAVLVTYEGWGHTSLTRSDCVAGQVAAFLGGPERPVQGDCPASQRPFGP